MEGQSKISSLLETTLNVGSGFIISMIVWEFWVKRYLGLDTNIAQNIVVTLVFTVVSIVRGYTWRRIFNKNRTK